MGYLITWYMKLLFSTWCFPLLVYFTKLAPLRFVTAVFSFPSSYKLQAVVFLSLQAAVLATHYTCLGSPFSSHLSYFKYNSTLTGNVRTFVVSMCCLLLSLAHTAPLELIILWVGGTKHTTSLLLVKLSLHTTSNKVVASLIVSLSIYLIFGDTIPNLPRNLFSTTPSYFFYH